MEGSKDADFKTPVALLTESVDRNAGFRVAGAAAVVALLTESVDRNKNLWLAQLRGARSLSSRRAWIEIAFRPARPFRPPVALLTESVDRNKRWS